MATNKNNNIFEKTSFLGNNSSEFVEALYADYLNDPSKLPEQWKAFFDGLKDERKKILENVNGPSWSPKKRLKPYLSVNQKETGKKTEARRIMLMVLIFWEQQKTQLEPACL